MTYRLPKPRKPTKGELLRARLIAHAAKLEQHAAQVRAVTERLQRLEGIKS
ncbi:MAG TPA: hypothetical protein VGI78_10845 [Acetobacteraceae bacterium]|jgi:hypothetical protein